LRITSRKYAANKYPDGANIQTGQFFLGLPFKITQEFWRDKFLNLKDSGRNILDLLLTFVVRCLNEFEKDIFEQYALARRLKLYA
jgi:hypothetical protein